jgi:hypothetical protein
MTGDCHVQFCEGLWVKLPRSTLFRTAYLARCDAAEWGRVPERPIYWMAMSPLLLPFHLILLTFAGWVNRHQLDVIEYLQEENRVLKERLGGRRLRFTDAERRRLARKAQALGRKVLNELETLVTPANYPKRNRQSSGCRAMIVVEHPAEALAPLNAVME